MKIRLAHLRTRQQGINFAVFEADARSKNNQDRSNLLAELTRKARNSGLAIEKSALAFMSCGKITFFGSNDLVRYLSNNWGDDWTHSIDV